ncbi:MAG TPA: hypothetical protein VJM49_21915, partial [Acidimicrobiales bacterium]|nr:hypothetical protein [Acidimicrobiales bacterium]
MQPYPPSATPPPGYPPSAPPGAPGALAGPAGPPVLHPSGWWYGAAGIIALVGIVVATVLIVSAVVDVGDRVDDFDRAPMPATLDVEITEPGGYTVYHEYDGAFDEDVFRGSPDVTITDPSGGEVFLRSYDASVTYDFGGHDGEALYSFQADETGTYVVDASMPGFESSGADQIAVGRGLGHRFAVSIVGGLLVALVSAIAAIVVAVVVGVRRGRSRRAQAPPPAGWAPPGTWGGPP